MEGYTFLIIALIGVALLFDFLNGLHDAANSIATVVSTRVLSPQVAVAWAAFFNFISFMFFSHAVANTIGKGIIDPNIVTQSVIFAALMGAIVWNVLTWLLGIPSSTCHSPRWAMHRSTPPRSRYTLGTCTPVRPRSSATTSHASPPLSAN